MASIQDERGYNQGFVPTEALRVRTRRRSNKLRDAIKIQPNDQILEIGCGTGEISFQLSKDFSHSFFTGADLSRKFVDMANQTYQNDNLQYKAYNFLTDTPEDTYDCIIGNGILHHLYNQLDASLLKMFSLLKPGGRIAFWEPNLILSLIHI